ncbi:carbon monoxide dehydrogenase subunit G [Iodidimonas sp. SYSU 1G8]|uniref:SRPBCC family protein n=1 Tax=Iodidimonas sp. SYSU 1G8 TaxID=3133967 RepID=UPI0031FF2989
MDMSGEYHIPAPRQRVWEALNDPEILGRCIPGCESIQKTSETEMSAVVQAKVGPVSAKFSGAVTLEDMDPPNGYTIRGEGKGGVAGFAKGTAKVALADEEDGTRLTYTVDAAVGGKLAQVGARLVSSTIRKMADEFFGTFSQIVASGNAAAEAVPRDDVLPAAESGPADAEAPHDETSYPVQRGTPEKSWGSPFTIGLLVIAAILVIYFLVT